MLMSVVGAFLYLQTRLLSAGGGETAGTADPGGAHLYYPGGKDSGEGRATPHAGEEDSRRVTGVGGEGSRERSNLESGPGEEGAGLTFAPQGDM